MRRIAGTDAGRVVLISSQHFIPVILHGRKQERKREGMRDVERREGGWEKSASAASTLRCSPLNVSMAVASSCLPLHLTFLPVLQCIRVTTRWRLFYRKVLST